MTGFIRCILIFLISFVRYNGRFPALANKHLLPRGDLLFLALLLRSGSVTEWPVSSAVS
jgi:hypothetical protein